MTTVIANYHEGIGCSYHRVYLPAKYMINIYVKVAIWTKASIPPDEMLEKLDIFWFNRVPTFPLEELLRKREQFKFKIVADIDDHWILYPHHELASSWATSGAHEAIQKALITADAVFCTTPRLRDAILPLNTSVWSISNALPYDHDQFRVARVPSDKIRFMYAGGSSHYHDLKTIQGVFKRLGQDAEFRAKGEIILAGYDHQYGMGKVNSVFERMLRLIKPARNYSVYPVRPVDSYMQCYNYADVALAPLEDSTFNAHKSNLKMLEAGCAGIPLIASNVKPYSETVIPEMMLCNTPDQWFEAIKFMLQNPLIRDIRGMRLREYVKNYYTLRYMNSLRIGAFESIM